MKITISTKAKPKSLKITQEDFDRLRDAVLPVVKQHPDAYRAYKAEGLSDMRYNWDVVRKSGFKVTELYHYLNDTHINAALAAILENSGKSNTKVRNENPNQSKP